MSKQQRQADQVMAAGSVRKRKKRRPIGETDPRLHAPERPGYMRRFVNDIKNRIQRFLEGGYEFVQDEQARNEAGDEKGGAIRVVVGQLPEHQGVMHAYLMEIPNEYYNEDLEAKNNDRLAVEETMRGGHVQGADRKDSDNFYNTAQGREITVDVGSAGK